MENISNVIINNILYKNDDYFIDIKKIAPKYIDIINSLLYIYKRCNYIKHKSGSLLDILYKFDMYFKKINKNILLNKIQIDCIYGILNTVVNLYNNKEKITNNCNFEELKEIQSIFLMEHIDKEITVLRQLFKLIQKNYYKCIIIKIVGFDYYTRSELYKRGWCKEVINKYLHIYSLEKPINNQIELFNKKEVESKEFDTKIRDEIKKTFNEINPNGENNNNKLFWNNNGKNTQN